jgi:hypothetical protein
MIQLPCIQVIRDQRTYYRNLVEMDAVLSFYDLPLFLFLSSHIPHISQAAIPGAQSPEQTSEQP